MSQSQLPTWATACAAFKVWVSRSREVTFRACVSSAPPHMAKSSSRASSPSPNAVAQGVDEKKPMVPWVFPSVRRGEPNHARTPFWARQGNAGFPSDEKSGTRWGGGSPRNVSRQSSLRWRMSPIEKRGFSPERCTTTRPLSRSPATIPPSMSKSSTPSRKTAVSFSSAVVFWSPRIWRRAPTTRRNRDDSSGASIFRFMTTYLKGKTQDLTNPHCTELFHSSVGTRSGGRETPNDS